jgi:UDP-3-O-[3-hydroxymyristoyl] glucosamine N-acyltransferase
MNEYSVHKIIETIKPYITEIKGEINIKTTVRYIKPFEQVDEYSLDWINSNKKEKQLMAHNSKAKVIICDNEVEYNDTLKNDGKVLLCVENPKLAVALLGTHLFSEKYPEFFHPSAVIDNAAEIGKNVFIGANCTIGKCIIGNNVTIHPNVVIYNNVTIGDNVLIHAGAVLGTDGLGCERLVDGTLVKFPHLGGVKIGNNVEIGANSYIAKGALSVTSVGDGTKINGLCFIAHNVIIGKNVLITGQVMIAGSVEIGDNVLLSPGVVIREQVKIGKAAHIGLGAVVTKNVPDNEVWTGIPAKKFEK